ncbi:hypothetical protein [Sphingomonas oryzagri]
MALRRLAVLTGIGKNRLWRIRKGSAPTIDELHRILVAIDGRFDLHRLLEIWHQTTPLTEEQIAVSIGRLVDHLGAPDDLPRVGPAPRPQLIHERGRGRLLIPVKKMRSRHA